MSATLAKVRAALTAIGVAFVVAVLLVGLIVVAGGVVGFVWGTLFGDGDGTFTDRPAVEFETTLENGSVVLTHTDGDEIDPTRLTIYVAGESRGTWADHGGSDTVTEDDSIRIEDASAGEELTVRWRGDSQEWVVHRETL